MNEYIYLQHNKMIKYYIAISDKLMVVANK